MRKPWLVQRCAIRDGKLIYDYMGCTEYEIGDQARSLKRIFAKGFMTSTTTVIVEGNACLVYLLAAPDFPVADYQHYLQEMANGQLRLKEWIRFDHVLRYKLGLPLDFQHCPRITSWFDFQNDILWTLSQEDRDALVEQLNMIKEKWASAPQR